MIFTKTKIKDLFVIDLELRNDPRGHFARVFDYKLTPSKFKIVQVNKSLTKEKGTIRGMHYQNKPKQEGKYIRCIRGSIYDVVIDLRKDSKTYGKWFGVKLTENNNKLMLVPKGFAHGFQSLEDNVEVEYFVSEYYSPKHESGIRWNDKKIGINWPIKRAILSDKDANWEDFK